jgi:hypothetical protein
MVEFDMRAARSRFPGAMRNHICRHGLRHRRRYVVERGRMAREVDTPPFVVTTAAKRTQAGWVGHLVVRIISVEFIYPAVRHLAPELLVVSTKTDPTLFTTEDDALELANSLRPKLIAQLSKEVFKL